ncbi:type VI secretion protein IcmF [Pseudomonas aeruginosa]|nr:type VI secretion protein IcmF [Pseudomonas aeruginosa]
MSGATLFMLVLLLVLLALLLGALGWWWRTRGGTEIRSFYAAVRQMGASRAGRAATKRRGC